MTEMVGLLAFTTVNNLILGFSGGSVVKNLPANAEARFDPWSGKIPHAVEQLSLCTTATEPVL